MKILLFALLGTGVLAIGQNRLAGTFNSVDGSPIAAASVYAPDLHKGTLTDDSGKFILQGLPAGKITIVASAAGNKTWNQQVTIVTGDNTIAISLEPQIHEMDEVIVSTAFNRLQSQNVMKVEHASLKNLQQRGIATITDGLATIPGVSQVSTGVSIGKPVIRGLSGNRVLVYTQGVRLENQQFGEEHGLGLNESGMESVEVIKGPASLLYGSDALGGVLYFNSERFADANQTTYNLNQKLMANTLGSVTSIGIKTSKEKWKFLLRGGFSSHADYRIPDGRVLNTRFSEADIKAAAGYSDKNISSVLRYNFNRLSTGLPEGEYGGNDNGRSPEFPRQEVGSHILSLQNKIFLGNASLEANIGYVFNDRKEFEDTEDPALRMKLSTANYDLRFHFPKPKNLAVIAGVQGMFQSNANTAPEILIPDATVRDAGVFATANLDLDKHVLQAGLRYDYRAIETVEMGGGDEAYFAPVDKNFSSFNASAGLRTNWSNKLTTRLNLASGFRAPNLAELTSNGEHEGSNRFEIGNANLKTEQNIQTDLNVELKSGHFEFFVNGFYNHIDRYIFIAPTGEFVEKNPVYRYTQADATLYGGEAGIHFHPHPLDWLHFESSFETVTGERRDGESLPLMPAKSWSNTLRTEFDFGKVKDGFARLTVQYFAEQDRPGEFEFRTPEYALLHMGVGGSFKVGSSRWDLALHGKNLLDRRYVSHLSRLRADQVPDMGRNIILSLNVEL